MFSIHLLGLFCPGLEEVTKSEEKKEGKEETKEGVRKRAVKGK